MAKEKIRYFLWRDGRPRWVPGPKARALGFKGQDLKDDAGAWLKYGAAIDLAQQLNAALDAKVEGTPAPLAIARTGAPTITELVDQFLARPKLQLDERVADRLGKKKLARSTRLAYHAHGQLLKDWLGDAPAGSVTPAMVEGFYDDRVADSGITTANAIMRSWKTIFYFGEDKLRWPIKNPVKGLEMDEADGRLVQWSRAEIDCFVAVADYLGWPSLGDALTLALLTSQRRNDLLPLRGAAIDAGGIYRFVQSKTGREAKVKAVPMLLDRIQAMHARKRARWGEAALEYEIICESTGLPYPPDGSYFGRRFSAVKLIAAGGNGSNSDMAEALQLLDVTDAQVAAMPIARIPSMNDKWFRDLRDTAVTWLAAAGCDRYEIATVTGLSIKSVDTILQKHYLVLDDGFAIRAGDKLAAHLGKIA